MLRADWAQAFAWTGMTRGSLARAPQSKRAVMPLAAFHIQIFRDVPEGLSRWTSMNILDSLCDYGSLVGMLRADWAQAFAWTSMTRGSLARAPQSKRAAEPPGLFRS